MKIECAAIERKEDGRIWIGERHHDCIHDIVKSGEATSVTRELFTQGFLTDQGDFVDRNEAHRIAVIAEQIKDTIHDSFDILISEDLY